MNHFVYAFMGRERRYVPKCTGAYLRGISVKDFYFLAYITSEWPVSKKKKTYKINLQNLQKLRI